MDVLWNVILYVIIFLYGIIIGSFLNVCIYRIPLGESLAKRRSHCMTCGYQLRWFDLFPLFSWLFLRGRCRKCGAKISAQYPIVEASNGLLYVIVFACCGLRIESIFYCLLVSALLVLSVIDLRTFIIPLGINIFILVLGVLHLLYRILFVEEPDVLTYLIGLVLVSGITGILYLASKGRAIGGGDVKLMGAAGLLIGWRLILLAFVMGCIFGSIIHPIRMKVSKADRVLAMGPYLSAGILFAVLFGTKFLDWYLGFVGFR